MAWVADVRDFRVWGVSGKSMLSLLLSTLVTKTNFTNVNNCILGLVHFAVKDVRSLIPKFKYSYRVNYIQTGSSVCRPPSALPAQNKNDCS